MPGDSPVREGAHLPADRVRADFDRIARLQERAPAAEAPYLRWLAAQLPASCDAALEVGCGTGEMTALLAERAARVVALDLSPEMVRVARERLAGAAHVELVVADVGAWPAPREAFDCVASVNTLHHLAFEETIAKLRDALRPGGTLLLMDVLDRGGVRYLPLNAAAALVRRIRHPSPPRELRRAYEEHGRGERYLRPGELRASFRELLPGARIRHHLLWRYSVVWRKPV